MCIRDSRWPWMTLNDVMTVIWRYFIEFGRFEIRLRHGGYLNSVRQKCTHRIKFFCRPLYDLCWYSQKLLRKSALKWDKARYTALHMKMCKIARPSQQQLSVCYAFAGDCAPKAYSTEFFRVVIRGYVRLYVSLSAVSYTHLTLPTIYSV